MKRGLSQVVSIMLLIVLGIVIIGGLFIWQSGFLEILQKDAAMKKLCSTLEFRADGLCYKTLTSPPFNGGAETLFTVLEFNAINDGGPTIIEFLLILTDKSGNSATYSILSEKKISAQQGDKFTTDEVFNIEAIDKISIIPKINFNDKSILCEERKKVFDNDGVESC